MNAITIHSDLADYIAEHGEPLKTPTRCSGCGQRAAVARDRVNDYCEVCWASRQSYENGRRDAIQTISSAVLSAIREAGLDEIVARRAVEYLVETRD